jgi:hypothetical protein
MYSSGKQVLTTLTLSVLVILIFGQDAFSVSFRNPRLHSNPWSLQIALDEKLKDDDLHGVRFSLSHRFSRHGAARFSVGIVGHETNYLAHIYDRNGVIVKIDDRTDFELTGVNLSAQYLFYPSPNRNLNFFWGFGPRVSVEEYDPYYDGDLDWDFPYYWCDDPSCDNTTRLGAGVEGSLGMEWFLGRRFSLLAEYGFTLQNEWYLFDVDYYDGYGHVISRTESFNDGLHLDGSQIKLGVAFHF